MRRKLMAAWGLLALAAEPAFAHHVMGGVTPTSFIQGLLSGFGHPVIGLDHLAAVIAVGCLAATQTRGVALALGFVLAMIAGAALHARELMLPASEALAALAVIALGAALIPARRFAPGALLALFAAAGFVHGYALGESIVGAEPTPLYAYFAGLALIQTALALAAMVAARALSAKSATLSCVRLTGAGIAGIGIAILVQQAAAGA